MGQDLNQKIANIINSLTLRSKREEGKLQQLDFGYNYYLFAMDLSDEFEFEVLPELTPEEEQKLQEEHRHRLTKFYDSSRPYSLDHWYARLQPYTFKSRRFPLTCGQAYLLNCLYQDQQDQLQRHEVINIREQLIIKVDRFIKQSFSKGCFMKLATRSPKDRGWSYNHSQQEVEKVKQIIINQKNTSHKSLMNSLYLHFLSQSKDKLRVTSGEDFIRIFAGSERIQIDLGDMSYLHNHAFERLSKGDHSGSEEVLVEVWGREWVDCQWEQEFRCFYHQYTLTAISQYDQYCYFQSLQGKQTTIKDAMVELFERMKPKLQDLQMSSGAMDVVFRPSVPHSEAVLIEVNVFDENSRGCLFDWKADRSILEDGPLQVRMVKEVSIISKYQLCKMHGMIEKGIDWIMEQAMEGVGLSQQWASAE